VSTDWNIRCVDCNVVCRFNDANHQDGFMRKLIKHRDAIAALAPLLAEASRDDLSLHTYWGDVDAAFFAAHAGHKLVPHNEYGDDDDQCPHWAKCDACGNHESCTLVDGHEGPHQHRAEDRRAR